MKKNLLVLAGLLLISANAFAADVCNEVGKIEDAAKLAFKGERGAQPSATSNGAEYSGTTKDGTKDKWTVEMSVQEECLTAVIVYTQAGTCKVIGTPFEVSHRDCG